MFGGNEEHESDNEEEVEIYSPNFKPSYVVIAIDTHSLMFKTNENGIIPFRSCLEALYKLADSLIFKQDRLWYPFAILLHGHTDPLIKFDTGVVESIKILKAKTKLSDADLTKHYQRNKPTDLAEFFSTCKKIFNQVDTEIHRRILLYLSNDAQPINNKFSRSKALSEIKTFITNGIEFQILPLTINFNYNLFYNEVFNLLDVNKVGEGYVDINSLLQKLSSVMVKKDDKKVLFYPFKNDINRFLKCIRLHVFPNVQLYSNFMTKDGKKVVSLNQPGGVEPYYRIKFISEAKADIKFDQAEKDSLLDHTVPKGISLLYIGDPQIKQGHVITRPKLLKPDPKEELNYFQKFWDNCVATRKALICICKFRQPDRLRYVELVPILIDEKPMFLENSIPYGSEIVEPFKKIYPEEEGVVKRKQLIETLVNQLTIQFNINMLPDVPLRRKKAYVKAKLLEEPLECVMEAVDLNHMAIDLQLESIVNSIKNEYPNLEAEKKRKINEDRRRYHKKNKQY